MWLTTAGDSGLWRVDPSTMRVSRVAAVDNPTGVVVAEDVAYVASAVPFRLTVARFDARSGARLDVIDGGSGGLAIGSG